MSVVIEVPAHFVGSLRNEEPDVSLLYDETVARVDSELAAQRLRTAHRDQQNTKLRHTQAAREL